MNRNCLCTSLVLLVCASSVYADTTLIDPGDIKEFPIPELVSYELDKPMFGDSSVWWEVDRDGARIEISSQIADSALDSGHAQVMFTQPFTVSGEKARTLDMTITGQVGWHGEIIAGGQPGSFAGINITASLWDETANEPVENVPILEEVCEGLGDQPCRMDLSGSKEFSFTVPVVRGRQYKLHLTAHCAVESGEMKSDALCIFEHESMVAEDGCIRWHSFTVALEDDIVGLLEDLRAGQEELAAELKDLKDGQEQLEAGQQVLTEGQEEIIKLLKTPEEERPGWDEEGY